MSKMSQLHAELSEQASELGYESLGEAEQMGCEVDWENQKLIPPEEAAHNSILRERDELIEDLKKLVTRSEYDRRTKIRAIEFLRTEVKWVQR